MRDSLAFLEDTLRKSREFSQICPKFVIKMYGSAVNGLCLKGNSDLDVTLVVLGIPPSTMKTS